MFCFTETITVLYSSSLGVVDFHPSGDCAVIFLSAAEVIEGQLFKRRLAGLRSVSSDESPQIVSALFKHLTLR